LVDLLSTTIYNFIKSNKEREVFYMIGNKIKQRRLELGMTQEELAKKCGYKSKATINKIENNINDVNQSKLIRIADALDVPPIYFIDEIKHDFPDSKRHLLIYAQKLQNLSKADFDNVCQYIDFLSSKKGDNQ
jgi:transcriptional regulator with XRE-family HTH domain